MYEGMYGELLMQCEIDRRRAGLEERQVAFRRELDGARTAGRGGIGALRTVRGRVGVAVRRIAAARWAGARWAGLKPAPTMADEVR